ncbi:hypothetical protein ABMY44_00965 [Pseudoalteromonas sp. Cnat2-41]|uniref:hypothetical protein n=1 Tax=unclassified Pseudoalteromonas TaxID=194690 RepID=UPI001EF7BC74|nr:MULTISPECIES: hypothetical protein [unclassified Pseudoalteromonas]MCF2860731.1 hypothetical protein [Pseudoalteromonas sp. CNAT2-18]MCG7556600.1 hypothetical protein [Pseudoalteromonas sp. CNAT2-18.1]
MFAILTDHYNLTGAFARLSMVEAMRVQRNLDQVFTDLKLPSDTLLNRMREEGLLKDAIAGVKKPHTDASESVIQSHLGQLFLDYHKLKATLAKLSLAEQVACKETFTIAAKALNLPSADLAAMMAQEGVSVEAMVPKDPQQERINAVRERLNQAASQQQSDAQRVRDRLNSLVEEQQDPKDEVVDEGAQVVPLRRQQA